MVSSNIDLFGTRKAVPVASKEPKTAAAGGVGAGAAAAAAVKTSATAGTSTMSPVALSQSKNALQAEILRLEAEAEQLAVDEESFARRKQRLVEIDRLLLQVLDGRLTLPELCAQHKAFVCKEMYFRIAELANNARAVEDRVRFTDLCAALLSAAKATDPLLGAELSADIEKELALENPKTADPGQLVSKDGDSARAYEQVLQQWLRQTNQTTVNINGTDVPITPGFVFPKLGGSFEDASFPGDLNSTFGTSNPQLAAKAIVRFPSAVPFNLLPLMLRSPEIAEDEVTLLKRTVFTDDVLQGCMEDHGVFLATFRGRPTVSVAETFNKAQARINLIPGLGDKLRLFVLPEYRPSPQGANNTMLERYSGVRFEPVFVVLHRSAEPRLAGVEYPVAFAALLGSLVTSFIYATDVNSLNAGFVQRALAGDDTVVDRVFALVGGALMVQLAHELGHLVMAAVHGVKIGVPFVLPSLQIGLFGGITRYLGFPKSRKAAFDVAIAGPLLGFAVSLSVLVAGLGDTVSATPEALAQFPALPTGFFATSWLLYTLLDNSLHIAEAAKVATSLTPVHPFVIIGATGLLVNAYNFLPIGRLDGGRVVMAIGGRQTANSVSFGALIGTGVSLLSSGSAVLFFWLLTVVFLQRGADLPPEDDVTPIGEGEANPVVWGGRLAALVFCLLLASSLILPIPLDPNAISSGTQAVFDASSKLI